MAMFQDKVKKYADKESIEMFRNISLSIIWLT